MSVTVLFKLEVRNAGEASRSVRLTHRVGEDRLELSAGRLPHPGYAYYVTPAPPVAPEVANPPGP